MVRFKGLFLLAALMMATTLYTPDHVRAAQSSQPLADRRPRQYILPGTNIFPEGIAFDRSSGDFFVSSTTDGTIFRGNVREPLAEVFLPGTSDGRTTAVGLKVDNQGRLFIAGGNTGKVFVYDTTTGGLLATFDNELAATFINDVAITKDGAAYFTDSLNPFLYKLTQNEQGQFEFERWLDFTGTAFVYQPGFNANGITASPNGKYLVVVQSNTGKLFRIEIATKEVTEINLGGATVMNGDGILLKGRTLYVVRNRQELIVEIRLSGHLSSGTVISSTTDPSFAFPTTIAEARGQLLVVNSQFDRRGPGLTPDLPFTVSSIKRP
jgi:Cu-Zn family superoxide dismutase